MTRKRLLIFVSCSLVAAIALARTAPAGGQSVAGIVTAVDGSRISLLDGRITIDASKAIVRGEHGPGDGADIQRGDRISATVTQEVTTSDLVARMIQIHAASDAVVSGTVEVVDTAGGTITVLGTTIQATSATIIRGLGGVSHESVAAILPGEEVRVDIEGSRPGLTARSIVVVSPIPDMFSTVIGLVESIENNVWTIRADRRIRVTTTEETRITGTPVAGDRVRVDYRTDSAGQHFAISVAPEPAPRARLGRGSVLEVSDTTPNPQIADRVAGVNRGEKGIVFIGAVIAINGNVWDVDGTRLIVNDGTRLINGPELGDRVHIVASRGPEGTFALEIETVF